MFDDLASLFCYNIVDAYDRYVSNRDAKTAGRNRHLRAALGVAEAAFHFREHLPHGHAKSRRDASSECPDYRLIADVTNAAKHRKLDRETSEGPPLVRTADDIHETIVCVQFDDENGTYVDAQTAVLVTCTDGESRSLDAALTNVVNYWGNELVRIGALASFRNRLPPEHGRRFASRAEARHPDLESDQGLRFMQNFQILRYNKDKGYAEPVDLTGSKLEFRVYKPPFSLSFEIRSPAGDVITYSSPLSEEESFAYARLSSDADRRAFEHKLTIQRKDEIQKKILTATMPSITLRPYTPADEDAAIELWWRTWAQHYPRIDFNARVAWWRERWRQELVPVAHIVLAEIDGKLAGFVTVDPKTMYLDQIVVAPEFWGADVARALADEAKRLSPRGLDLLVNKDNARAIRFYEKHGFVYAGEDKNPVSGIAVNRMSWRP